MHATYERAPQTVGRVSGFRSRVLTATIQFERCWSIDLGISHTHKRQGQRPYNTGFLKLLLTLKPLVLQSQAGLGTLKSTSTYNLYNLSTIKSSPSQVWPCPSKVIQIARKKDINNNSKEKYRRAEQLRKRQREKCRLITWLTGFWMQWSKEYCLVANVWNFSYESAGLLPSLLLLLLLRMLFYLVLCLPSSFSLRHFPSQWRCKIGLA